MNAPEEEHRSIFLSTLPAGRTQRRLALGAALASAVIFLAVAPFAKLPLAHAPAFLPLCQSALIVNASITALLLYGQFRVVRSRALLALASGYLFCALVALATLGNNWLPEIVSGDMDTGTNVGVAAGTCALLFAALAALWRRQPHSVLGLWVMVAMCALILGVALAAVFNHEPYDLGWYAGHTYGLLASSFVLVVLLLENGALHLRLAEAHAKERRERRLMQEQSAELKVLNKQLDAFSHTISHALREPLRRVDGYANMIAEDHGGRLDANARRLLTILQASAQHMARMIEDLLAFSKLGRKRPTTQSIALENLVNRVIAEQLMTYADRKIDFTVGELGAANADPALLKQAFANLIGNAIKYTRGRYPAKVEIGRMPPEVRGGAQVYFVRDNGAGFDMRQSHWLFGVFQRFHSAQEFEGTGVGLAIVERIILSHGGRIWAESRPGEGAIFLFTLAPDSAEQFDDSQQAAA